jgi:predicted NBD/HSP70 family sugar kinase
MRPRPGTTPQLLRQVNAEAVLGVMRRSAVMTGTDLMHATGLTRATVIAVCEDLLRAGWLHELGAAAPEGPQGKGRPARRFEFAATAGFVLGVDIGVAKVSVLVADLRGRTLGRSSLPFAAPDLAGERVDVVSAAALAALDDSGVDARRVLAVGAGLPAPIDRDGNVVASQEFWGMFDVGLRTALLERHGWTVLLENDANLAALGERWRGAAADVSDLAVMLSGERLGTGVMESGRLLHGSRGSIGEMGYLHQVVGVGTPEGMAGLARRWGSDAVAGPAPTMLRDWTGGIAGKVTAEMVFQAADGGDPPALSILARLADRMARVIGSLATLLNPELVVLGGAVSCSAAVLLDPIAAQLPLYTHTPPRLAVSTLGEDIVAVGALRHALDHVDATALTLNLC